MLFSKLFNSFKRFKRRHSSIPQKILKINSQNAYNRYCQQVKKQVS
nr:MAG TPA: hypothetical protein [Caudoviricetes sp.]